MAVRTPTISNNNDPDRMVVTWTGITEADEGAPVQIGSWDKKTVQLYGDLTTSGAITLRGSNEGASGTYGALHDVLGADLVLTDNEPRMILESPLWIKPVATAGSAVDMSVTINGTIKK